MDGYKIQRKKFLKAWYGCVIKIVHSVGMKGRVTHRGILNDRSIRRTNPVNIP